MTNTGKTTWLIPDGYMSNTATGDLVSHESVCVLNLSGETAHIDLTLYFEDREPLRGFHATCAHAPSWCNAPAWTSPSPNTR